LFIAYDTLASRKNIADIPCIAKSFEDLKKTVSKLYLCDFPYTDAIDGIQKTERLVLLGEYLMKTVFFG
jgi:hypothetical protein